MVTPCALRLLAVCVHVQPAVAKRARGADVFPRQDDQLPGFRRARRRRCEWEALDTLAVSLSV